MADLNYEDAPVPKVPARSPARRTYPGMAPTVVTRGVEPPPLTDNAEYYTPGGRARFENWQLAQTRANTAANAPAPTAVRQAARQSSLPAPLRWLTPGTQPGSMSITMPDGTTTTRQGTMALQSLDDQAKIAAADRENYITEHQNTADATKPSYLTNRQQQKDQNRLGNQTQDLQNQILHEQLDRYHQATPAIIDRLNNSPDWSPEDRKQLLDTVRTYHEFNTALMRQMEENRRQQEGDRRGDQTDTRIGQGQRRIDAQQNQFGVTSGQRDRGLSQRDRSLDQSDQRIQTQKNRPASRSGFGALMDLLSGRKPTTQPAPTTQPDNGQSLIKKYPYPPPDGGYPGAFTTQGQNNLARTTHPGMTAGERPYVNEQTRGAIKADKHEQRPGSFSTPGRNLLTEQSMQQDTGRPASITDSGIRAPFGVTVSSVFGGNLPRVTDPNDVEAWIKPGHAFIDANGKMRIRPE